MRYDNRIFIMSAEVFELDDQRNHRRTKELWDSMERLGLLAKPAEGCYKGYFESSIVITERDSDDLRALLMNLSRMFSQECIMVREPSGSCYLLSDTFDDNYIGEWREVPASIAKMAMASTKIDDRHFITTKY